MSTRYLNFIRSISICPTSRLGVILVVLSFVCLVILELARLLGIITSAFAGLITYMLFPALFVIGLVLIPVGWCRIRKKTGKTTRELIEKRFESDAVKGGFLVSRLARTIALLSVISIVFLAGFSMRMLSFMDQPVFCGTACHSVMNPEWVTYQQSPHSRVACVECHVGEGAVSLIDSKLNGMWQMVSVTFDILERPIPTPVHQLRPARETCEKCHWPEKFYGNRIKRIVHYDTDEASTPKYTTLSLKVDIGDQASQQGIHWHVAEENEVRYSSLDDERESMVWVESKQPDGNIKRYTNRELVDSGSEREDIRQLDCVDCHNRATHIYEMALHAVDKRIQLGQMERSLPFLKREAVGAITANYPTKEAAMDGIANHMHGFYRRNFPDIANNKIAQINSTVAVLQQIHSRNIHSEMNITWDTYPNHIGHANNKGCFRCHNSNLVDQEGESITYDCSYCHSILAYDSDEPFRFLQTADTTSLDYQMHLYLQEEFLNSSKTGH
ncbi:MAG: NapC/NirT family cytochrome c [candidate division Zixibacteria bacterium]|nr:NapC/NirT family cytochrome c [candidate division Zixibacteria bacterium]